MGNIGGARFEDFNESKSALTKLIDDLDESDEAIAKVARAMSVMSPEAVDNSEVLAQSKGGPEEAHTALLVAELTQVTLDACALAVAWAQTASTGRAGTKKQLSLALQLIAQLKKQTLPILGAVVGTEGRLLKQQRVAAASDWVTPFASARDSGKSYAKAVGAKGDRKRLLEQLPRTGSKEAKIAKTEA